MDCLVDPFTRPQALNDVKEALNILDKRIKIVEGLEHAKSRLEKTTSLNSNTLSKCKVFARYVNETSNNQFYSEVCKLSLDELAFSSISFEERRLDQIVPYFTALDIRKYMMTSRVSCLHRGEIFIRLKNISAKLGGSRFSEVYVTAQGQEPAEPEGQTNLLDPEPDTTAREANAFEFSTPRWEKVENMFGKENTEAARRASQSTSHPESTNGIGCRFSRGFDDAILWLKLGYMNKLALLFDGQDRVLVDVVRLVFGDTIADAIEESDLRKWEKRNGFLHTTRCVRVVSQVEFRLNCDTRIVNELFT